MNEPAERLIAFKGKSGFTSPMLIDADASVIKAYGVLNEKKGTLPHPAVAILDAEGKLRWLHVDPNYRERPSVETLLDVLDGLVVSAAH